MIIIKKAKHTRKAWAGTGFQKIPISDAVKNVDVQGAQEEGDIEDEKERKKFLKTHPLRRKERFGEDVPSIIRWLWNPRTGEMISSVGRATEHALMLSNYKRRRGRKGGVDPYDMWIRGFYFPQTHELAMRPFAMDVFKPKSEFAIRTPEDEQLYYQMAKRESDLIQDRIAQILEKQLGKFKKVHRDVGDEYLRDHFQGVGGERW